MEPNIIDDWYYSFKDERGIHTETKDKKAAKAALRAGKEVSLDTRKVFYSGPTYVRVYLSTNIRKMKDFQKPSHQ